MVEIKASSLPDDKKTSVARSLSHSSTTVEKHYPALEKKKIIEGYTEVGSLLRDKTITTSPLKKRRRFTDSQTSLIKEAFAAQIIHKLTPSKQM